MSGIKIINHAHVTHAYMPGPIQCAVQIVHTFLTPGTLIIPVVEVRNLGSERFSHLPEVTQHYK